MPDVLIHVDTQKLIGNISITYGNLSVVPVYIVPQGPLGLTKASRSN